MLYQLSDPRVIPAVIDIKHERTLRGIQSLSDYQKGSLILFILAGSLSIEGDDHTSIFMRGDMVILDLLKEPNLEYYGEGSFVLINLERGTLIPISTSTIERLIPHLTLPQFFTIQNSENFIKISNVIKNLTEDMDHYYPMDAFIGIKVYEFFILIHHEYQTQLRVTNSTKDHTSLLNRLKSFIEKNYASTLNIQVIEQYMEMNYDYLNVLFKRNYQLTINKYIQHVRVKNAKELIKETKMKFSTICELVGISDPYYFSKLFKSMTGYTPTKYAKMVRHT